MKVTIKILQGTERTVDVSESTTVHELKDKVDLIFLIPASNQRLVYKGKTLADDMTLQDAGVPDGAKIHLMPKKTEAGLGLSGGSLAGSSKAMAPPQRPHVDFFSQLDTFLRKHLTQEQTSLVVNEFRKNCQLMVDSMNFEDIERFAASNCTEF